MLATAFAAMVLFAAPETAQGQAPAPEKSAEAAQEAPKKHSYTATPTGSRMPRKVCVTQAPKSEEADKPEKKAPKAE